MYVSKYVLSLRIVNINKSSERASTENRTRPRAPAVRRTDPIGAECSDGDGRRRSEAVEDEQRDDDDASDDDAEKTDDARGDATRDVFAKNDRHARLRGGEQALGRDGLQARARRRKRVARTVVRCASDSGWGGCF